MNALPRQLDVLLHGQLIGNITHLGGDRTVFAFTDSYAADPERPTLSLSFSTKLGELIRTKNSTHTKLTPYFSNLLPEGPLRAYLAKLVQVKPMREYPLLAELGEDLPGAVVVRSASEAGMIDRDLLLHDAAKPLRVGPLRFSLAGVQLKFSAMEKAEGGFTIPADGEGGSWIVKLPSLRFAGLAANEFSMMTLARHVGIDVPEIRLISLDAVEGLPQEIERLKEDAFAIRRFDRAAHGVRIHTEDFAQVFEVYPEDKYERASYRTIATVLWRETNPADVAEFIRRLVFNTLIGNGDMHLKNWSLIYPDRRTARLSPAYDFVSTIAYLPDDEAALKFVGTRKPAEVTSAELTRLAEKASIPKELVLDVASETVARFHEAWRAHKSNLPMANEVRTAIERHLPSLSLANV